MGLARVLSRRWSRSLWSARLWRAIVFVCVCCVQIVVKQELVVLVLEPCFCRELARTCFCACYGARRAARLGVRHLGTPGQARDGARGVRAGHVRLPGRAQREKGPPPATVRYIIGSDRKIVTG